MRPDFTVHRDHETSTYRAINQRSREYLDSRRVDFPAGVRVRVDEVVAPRRLEKRVARKLQDEGFQIITIKNSRCFADQRLDVQRAWAIAKAGNPQAALCWLVDLRDDVINDPTDPNSTTLLLEIDRVIDVVFGTCRTDRPPATTAGELTIAGHATAPDRDGFMRRLQRKLKEFDGVVVRLAISIVLCVDVYYIISAISHHRF